MPPSELAEREVLYAKLLDLARVEAERAAGDSRSDSQYRLQDYTARYLSSLITSKQFPKAAAVIAALPQDLRQRMNQVLLR